MSHGDYILFWEFLNAPSKFPTIESDSEALFIRIVNVTVFMIGIFVNTIPFYCSQPIFKRYKNGDVDGMFERDLKQRFIII